MATVHVTIPSMLATLVAGDRRFDLTADDLIGLLDALFLRHPQLRVHLLDEAGAIRPHVMLFHNDVAAADHRQPLGEGDRVTVLQAVSGGGA